MIFLIVIMSIVIIAISVFLFLNYKKKKYVKFVLQNSLSLKQLEEINARYKFYPYIDLNLQYTYDNEDLFNIISCEDYLIYQLQYIQNQITVQINKINQNQKLYSDYLSDVKNLSGIGKFQAPIKNFNVKKLTEVEKELLTKRIISRPTTTFILIVTLYCSKINGHIYNKKSTAFYDSDILSLIKRLNSKHGTFYNDRGIWDSLCKVERGKVSNKMRFEIYNRDGNKCCNCGISQEYAKLEIDHIVPISKGGKSTPDNLQTLCHKCNIEKGDSLYRKY